MWQNLSLLRALNPTSLHDSPGSGFRPFLGHRRHLELNRRERGIQQVTLHRSRRRLRKGRRPPLPLVDAQPRLQHLLAPWLHLQRKRPLEQPAVRLQRRGRLRLDALSTGKVTASKRGHGCCVLRGHLSGVAGDATQPRREGFSLPFPKLPLVLQTGFPPNFAYRSTSNNTGPKLGAPFTSGRH